MINHHHRRWWSIMMMIDHDDYRSWWWSNMMMMIDHDDYRSWWRLSIVMVMIDHDDDDDDVRSWWDFDAFQVKSFWAELTQVHFINIRFFGISFDLHLFYYRIGLFQNQLFGLWNVCLVWFQVVPFGEVDFLVLKWIGLFHISNCFVSFSFVLCDITVYFIWKWISSFLLCILILKWIGPFHIRNCFVSFSLVLCDITVCFIWKWISSFLLCLFHLKMGLLTAFAFHRYVLRVVK